MNNDPSVMIMPGSIAVGSARVESELLQGTSKNSSFSGVVDLESG